MKLFRFTLTACFAVLVSALSAAGNTSEDGSWTQLDQSASVSRSAVTGPVWVDPQKFEAYSMNEPGVRAPIVAAPNEDDGSIRNSTAILTVPRPEGGFERFQIVEVPTMAPELAAMFPDLITFSGLGIDNPDASIRGDIGPHGFRASVRNGPDSYYVDPYYQQNRDLHVSYYLRDAGVPTPVQCHADELVSQATSSDGSFNTRGVFGGTFRTYRVAMATTAEYTAASGGTVPATQAILVSLINRVNQIFEAEFAVRLLMVGDPNVLISTNGATDGYTDGSTGVTLGEAQTNITAAVGAANFDIGHLMNSTGGGRASLGVVCNNAQKARGTTGIAGTATSNASVVFLAHEMGHMFNASHTWNGVTGNCSPGEYSAANAYEPGSGSTIMSYAGTCGTDDVISTLWDAYYHRHSLDQIHAFVAGTGCDVEVASGNQAPVVNAGTDITVPVSTPFKLKAVGSDADGDTVFYNWEQFDNNGVGRTLGSPDPGGGPLMRSVFPSINPARYLPNNPAALMPGEQLPTVSLRDMTFRVTVRDFRSAGGGTNDDLMLVHVVDAPAAPFRVTVGNTPGEFWGGTTRVITWDVAGTDTIPFNIFNVNIMLSVDGGNNYPYTLITDTPNDGSQLVTLPNVRSNQVRIRVEPSGSGVFDVSDANIILGGQIKVNPAVADFGVVCPGDVLSRTIEVFNTGSGDLLITGVTKTGSSSSSLVPSDASPQPAPPLVISPGNHVNYTVHFVAPMTVGPVNATITITSDDLVNPVTNITATATVGAPNIVTMVADSGNFGDVCLGDFKDLNITVTNAGDCDLIITGLVSSSAEFLVAGTAFPIVVQAGTSVQVPLRFQPTSLGPKAATLQILSNDPDTPVAVVNVTGNVPAGKISVTPCPLDFGLVCPEDLDAREKTVTVCNVGECDLTVLTVSISRTDFTLEGVPVLPIVLKPGACFNFNIHFTPTSVGPKSETLTITSDDPDNPIVECEVTGETVASSIGVTQRIAFEPTVISTVGHCPSDEALVIVNTGVCDAKVTTITITGTNAESFKLTGLPIAFNPLVVTPGEQLGDGDLKVRFAPSEMLTERFHQAQVNVTYITDPFSLVEETLVVPLIGEACQTGFRLLVRAGGTPVENVVKITATIKGLNAKGKKAREKLKTNHATLRSVTAPDPFAEDINFKYHAEFGGVTNSTQIRTGEVLMKVVYKVGKHKKTRTLRFQAMNTCTFNENVVADF